MESSVLTLESNTAERVKIHVSQSVCDRREDSLCLKTGHVIDRGPTPNIHTSHDNIIKCMAVGRDSCAEQEKKLAESLKDLANFGTACQVLTDFGLLSLLCNSRLSPLLLRNKVDVPMT
jgi:hypothetical protein